MIHSPPKTPPNTAALAAAPSTRDRLGDISNPDHNSVLMKGSSESCLPSSFTRGPACPQSQATLVVDCAASRTRRSGSSVYQPPVLGIFVTAAKQAKIHTHTHNDAPQAQTQTSQHLLLISTCVPQRSFNYKCPPGPIIFTTP